MKNDAVNIVICGAGQQGRICKRLATENGFHVLAFVDDYKTGTVEGVPVYQKITDIEQYREHKYFIAIGNIEPRRRYYDEIKRLGLDSVNLIDKTACIEEGAEIGTGNYIYKFAISIGLDIAETVEKGVETVRLLYGANNPT